MKDAYTFDADEAGLDAAFGRQRGRVHPDLRALRPRGVSRRGRVRDDGRQGVERLPRADRVGRERADALRERRLLRRRRGRARRPAAGRAPRSRSTRRSSSRRRGRRRSRSRRVPRRSPSPRRRRRCRSSSASGSSSSLVRGDDRLSPEKLETIFEAAFRPATDEEIRAAFGAGGGSLGPVGVEVEVIADEALREGQYVAGANEDGWHLRGVEAGRDYEPTFADIRQAKEGDACPNCGGTLHIQTAIEVGHIFKLGTFHSSAFGATFLDEDGREKPLVMGSYGIGLARTMAAVVEQSHDENGIVWPRSVAPYDAHVVALPGAEEIALRGGRGALRRRARRPPRRPRPAGGGEVRRRRPDRLPDPRHGGQEEPRGRQGRRARPRKRRGEAIRCCRPRQGGLRSGQAAGGSARRASARPSSG